MSTDTMKRKVAKASALRLSPNEEASIIKQERERRRKLRLQQVREQEKFIAQQIRQDVKGRRDQQLQQLADDLRAKWEAAQAEKLQALEKIYLCTLNAIGEGHRQAKENEPDFKAMEMINATNKEKAEKRHREALKELKQHKEKQLRAQSWHIKARKKALCIEKERAAKIAGLPPPPPDPLQNIEVAQRLPLVKVCNVDNFSTSHYHLPEAYVDREMDTEQTDARSAAVEEEKRLSALQQEEDRERREQMEKAALRGSHALKMVQLAQDRDRLMKDLEQMQQDDLSRRRQIVAKMPQQLFEPAYRRAEIREEWQRELESAFEDMYTRNAKMRGDMVLQLKPQPLPDPSVASMDEDLDLTAEPEVVSGVERHPGGTEVEEQHRETGEPQSKKVLKRLLNRIRTQKDEWNAKAETSDHASDTLESGSLPAHQEAADVVQEAKYKSAIDSNEVTDNTVLAGKSILHPHEQAARIRMEAERNIKMEELEQQKLEQLELIHKLEEERKSLETKFQKMREEEQGSSVTSQEEEPEPAVVDGKPEESATPVFQLNTSAESLHIQMIREYQQRLIEQNRLHQQSLDDARKRLQEYQLLLKNRYPHLSTSHVESPGRAEESTRSAQSPQPKPPENDRPCAAVSPPSLLSSSNQSLSTEKLSQGPVHTQQRSPRNGRQVLEPAPSSASDFLALNQYKLRSESPAGVDSSYPHLFGSRSPQGLLSHSPNEARVTVTGSEKLSSTSSPGEHDSSSGTSYLPLPPALSLGLPQVDFSEPSISFTFPEEQVSRRLRPPPLGDFSNVQEFRERLLSSATEIRNQQDHLKEMQVQLDEQRESLLSKQKSQEQHLLHKQKELEEQIRRHQESLEKLLGPTEPRKGTIPADLHMVPEHERYQFMSALLKVLDDEEEEEEEEEDFSVVTNFESSNSYLLRPSGREQKWRPSKPPVTKTKLGPFLQQHELSAIMEVETPCDSGRRSSTGISELRENQTGRNERSGHGDPLQRHPDVTRMSSDSTLIPDDLSRLSASIRDETANQSRVTLSWRETLALEGSHDPAVADGSFPSVLHEILSSDGATSSNRLLMEEGASDLGPTGQGRSPTSACDYLSTTTISSGSFLTSEKTETSPGACDLLSDLQRCNYSDIEENKDLTSPSTATTWSHYLCPVQSRGHIQQIIEKYTKDLSASLGRNFSFHSPSVATDISSHGNHLSDTFHSLDPKLDSNVPTPSYTRSDITISPQSTQDRSRSTSNSSHREPRPYRSPASSLGLFHSQVVERRSPRRQREEDFSGSFLPLHPESTLNEPNVSLRDEPSCVISDPDQVNEDSLQIGTLQSFDATRRPFTAERSSTILTSAAEESGSFHEIAAAHDSELSEHPVSESLERHSVKSVHFEELPAVPENQHGEVRAGGEDCEDPDEGSNHTGSLNRTPKSEVLTHTSHPRSALQSLSSLTIGSSAGSLPSFICTWDLDSMRGILEEPDLTLVSLNDSSVVSSQPPVFSSGDHQDVNTSQSTFQPLQPEVDASGLRDGSDQSSVTMSLSQQFAEMSLEFTSTPGNLQEALMRKKRHFIQNSAKRVQEMKKKDRGSKEEGQTPDRSHVSDIQGDPQTRSELVSSDGGQLKKVVEVRVCTPEDRRLSEIEMQQRTIRLYNQLDEVKTRREEKMRQETYAKNREKAREFKKKTLEKLRAKR